MASGGHMVVTYALILILLCCTFADGLRTVLSDISGVKSFSQSKLLERSHPRSKRDVSISEKVSCLRLQGVVDERIRDMNNATRKDFAEEVEFRRDNKFSLQMAWTGNDAERIIVVTSEDGNSTCYLSNERGKEFTDISSKLNGSTVDRILSLQKHPLDSKTVYVVSANVWSSVSNVDVSVDGGLNFRKIELPFHLESPFIFHPSVWDLVLAYDDSNLELYLSKDRGFSWTKIKSSTVTAKWSTAVNSTDIYVVSSSDAVSFFSTSHTNVLEKSMDFGKTWKTLFQRVHTFGLGGKFLYASAYLSDASADERKLVVSTDGGESWNHARLPSITPDRFYSILDSTEGQIFLHVDDPGNTGRGTLYVSDATGVVFSESLKDHLYPNFEDLTDFYPVQSLRGVYIASQLLADDSIHTLISYNRGGDWQPISRPDGIPCADETKSCSLQIHNLYSIRRGIRANPPMSVSNAVGIILVHGHVAESLQTTDPDVYVSSDGGYSWRFALSGPHHYQIADHGGLLVAVPADTSTPSVIKFSTDEGRCWLSYNFTSEPITFTGLLVEPGNRAMTVAIWGYSVERIWHTHVINFTAIIDKQCGDSDYEDWKAHEHNGGEGCLLGLQDTFKRLKKDSWCYNGKAYEVQKTRTPCRCTEDDYDCDYGYTRVGEVCKEDPTVKGHQIDICKRGHEEELVFKGYHKIPGDGCVGGFTPATTDVIKLSVECGDDTDGPDVEHGEDQLIKEHAKNMELEIKKTNVAVVVVILIISSIIICIVLLTIYARKYRVRHLSYRYMSIRADGNMSIANTSSTSLYEDSSDEEMPATETKSKTRSPKVANRNGHAAGGKSEPATWHHESDEDLIQ